jgi:hypothetical protein
LNKQHLEQNYLLNQEIKEREAKMDKLKTESQKLKDELTNFEIKFNAEVERSAEFETKVKEQEAQLEIDYNQQVLF